MQFDATRFDGRTDAPVQYRLHRPMEGVQGFTRSHWTPLSDEYSLRVIPGGQLGRMPKKNDEKRTILAGHFDGRGDAPVRYQAHRPIEGVQRYGRSHWLMPPGKYSVR